MVERPVYPRRVRPGQVTGYQRVAASGSLLLVGWLLAGCGGAGSNISTEDHSATGASSSASPKCGATCRRNREAAATERAIQEAMTRGPVMSCPSIDFPVSYPSHASSVRVAGGTCDSALAFIREERKHCKTFNCGVEGYRCIDMQERTQEVQGGCVGGGEAIIWWWSGGF